MNRTPFIVGWTGHSLTVGIDQFGLLFEPDQSFPEGLHLRLAWLIKPAIQPLDPFKVPSPLVHCARHQAGKCLRCWGSKSVPPASLLDCRRPHPLRYQPTEAAVMDGPAIRHLLSVMAEADQQLTRRSA